MGKPISKALEDAITERSSVFANGNDRSRIPVTQEQREPLYSQIMQPIISAGDTIGSVLLLGKNERDVMGESEKMLIRTASGFLQDCFKNQLVGTLAAEDSFLYNKKQL